MADKPRFENSKGLHEALKLITSSPLCICFETLVEQGMTKTTN